MPRWKRNDHIVDHARPSECLHDDSVRAFERTVQRFGYYAEQERGEPGTAQVVVVPSLPMVRVPMRVPRSRFAPCPDQGRAASPVLTAPAGPLPCRRCAGPKPLMSSWTRAVSAISRRTSSVLTSKLFHFLDRRGVSANIKSRALARRVFTGGAGLALTATAEWEPKPRRQHRSPGVLVGRQHHCSKSSDNHSAADLDHVRLYRGLAWNSDAAE